MNPPPSLPAGIRVLERGWLSANNVLFTDGDLTVVVDSGYCTHSTQTIALIEGVLGPRSLDVLVNTHLHSDHCGGNAALQARYPAIETIIPPGQAVHVDNWNPFALTYLPTGQLCPQFKFTETLRPGTRVMFGSKLWDVLAAPGHDPNSLIFFEPTDRILISADALWQSGFGVVFPELDGVNAFEEVAATLDLIASLNPLVVIPGHGSVFAYNPEVLALARRKLCFFEENPARHAKHAAKVLLKFKLLEVQSQRLQDFVEWASATPHLINIHTSFFANIELKTWIAELCEGLEASGVASLDRECIFNM